MRLLLHNLVCQTHEIRLNQTRRKDIMNTLKSELEILKSKIQMCCFGIHIFKALLHYFTVNTRPQNNAAYVHLNYKCKLRQVKIKVTGQ